VSYLPAPHRHGWHSTGSTVAYIELRTTPHVMVHKSRHGYLKSMLDEIKARAGTPPPHHVWRLSSLL
jgi:hypothetical protein